MHTILLVIAAAGSLGLLVLASLAVSNVASSLYDDRLSAREADRRTAMTARWDGIERRTGVDRRWRAAEAAGAVEGPRGERRVGGRRLTDLAPAVAQQRAA